MVRIDGPILGREGLDYRILVRGSRGSLVQIVQNRLYHAGYYDGKLNGYFGTKTEAALKKYQKENELDVTGQVHFADLVMMGLVE